MELSQVIEPCVSTATNMAFFNGIASLFIKVNDQVENSRHHQPEYEVSYCRFCHCHSKKSDVVIASQWNLPLRQVRSRP